MQTIFDSCVPRDEVLRGELKDEIFAARLAHVVSGSAEDVYGNPELCMENTYPTSGLKELLQEALGRLSGAKPNASPIIRLETSFGGGKTHNLIALYHLAKSGVVNYGQGKGGALYDMEKDWRETTNLYDSHPDVVKELKAILEKQRRDGRTAPPRK